MPVRILRKGTFGLHVSYANGGYSNNLFADHAVLDCNNEKVILSINLRRNFHSRNKESNDYLDAVELNSSRDIISIVQIMEASVARAIENFVDVNTGNFKLRLILVDHPEILCNVVSYNTESIHFSVFLYLAPDNNLQK